MKRSGDITAAAIVLFFGSVLLVLFMLLGILGAALAQLPPAARYSQMMGLVFYAVFAGWGIATGVGILQLRSSARISILVMSATAIIFCVCGAIGLMVVPAILRQTPGAPPGFATIMVVVGAFMLLIPLGIAIWWLILFTRKRVITEFGNRGAVALPIAAAQPDASVPSSIAPQVVAASLPAPASSQIPLSIRIIAVLFVVSSAFMLLDIPAVARIRMPTIILGIVIRNCPGWAYIVFFGVLLLALSILTLFRRPWALDALIAFSLFNVANTLLFWMSPARTELFEGIINQEFAGMQNVSPGMNAAVMSSVFRTIVPVSLGAGLVFSLVALYFLLTRRKAFRAACDAGRSSLPA